MEHWMGRWTMDSDRRWQMCPVVLALNSRSWFSQTSRNRLAVSCASAGDLNAGCNTICLDCSVQRSESATHKSLTVRARHRPENCSITFSLVCLVCFHFRDCLVSESGWLGADVWGGGIMRWGRWQEGSVHRAQAPTVLTKWKLLHLVCCLNYAELREALVVAWTLKYYVFWWGLSSPWEIWTFPWFGIHG